MNKLLNKTVLSILILTFLFLLTSCNTIVYRDSIEGYSVLISKNHFGYSEGDLDSPSHFLPSSSFLADYPYIYGQYNLRERGLLNSSKEIVDVSMLILRYETNIYQEAKAFMLKNIPAYDDVRYVYGNYIFYENANHIELLDCDRCFLEFSTLACYNDENDTLVFIGICGNVEQKYKDDPQGNWVSFIDTYYGEYYDFSE